jgi:hypothetical protein
MLRAAPVRHISGNLLWTVHGTVWGLWELTPKTYLYLTRQEKLRFWQATTRALSRLPRHWSLLSLCARIDATCVLERSLSDVDLDVTPQLRTKTTALLERLDGVEMFERRFYLAAELPSAGQGWSASASATASNLRRLFGLTPPPVTVADRSDAFAAMARLEESIGAHLPLRRLTAAEQVWMMDRFPRRGLDEPLLEDYQDPKLFCDRVVGPDAGPGAPLRGVCLAGILDEPVYREGGTARLPSWRDLARKTATVPRYLQVQVAPRPGADLDPEDAVHDLVGHQAFVVQHSLPGEFPFPGGEWFAAAENVAFPVDWVVTGCSIPNTEATRRNATAQKHLVGQHEQWAGSPNGMPTELDQAHNAAEAEQLALAEDRNAPELELTAVFATWAEDPDECQRRARVLTDQLTDGEYAATRPVGRQEECYWAFWPGQPLGGLHKAYRQWMMPADLAAFAPLAGSNLGDPSGALLGFSLDGVVLRPVLLDPGRGTRLVNRRSGNIVLTGEPGAGKSYCQKRMGEDTLDRGGRLIILDRTPRAEWSTWAQVVAHNPAIVRLTGGSGLCFDPLRVFAHLDDRGVRYTNGYLTLLTGVEPRSLHGTILKRAIKVVADQGGGINDVVEELLAAGATDPAAREVGERMANLRNDELAGIVFGDGVVPDLDAHDAVVFAAPELQLPSREDLASEYARRHLSDEQIHSQALLYLLTAVARHVAFDVVTRFTALVLDEAWALTDSAEGQALVRAALRDGSKHDCGVWLSSQTVETFSPEMIDLFSRWMLFRMTTRAAERTLQAFGIQPEPGLVELFDGLDAGQCLHSDLDRNVGMLQISASVLAAHEMATRTDYEAALHYLAEQQAEQDQHAAAAVPGADNAA